MSPELDSGSEPREGLYQYCLEDGCTYAATWQGGSAADDPAMDHLMANPDHSVMGGASKKHLDNYRAQKRGENITRSEFDAQ
jgi:hypothetical protein